MRARVLLLILLAACHHGPTAPTPEQRAEIDRLFAAADAQDAAGDRRLEETIAASLTLVPTDKPCDVHFDRGDDQRFYEAMGRWATMRNTGDRSPFQAGRVDIVTGKTQLAVVTSAARALRRDDERALRARETPYDELDGAALVERARALATTPPGPELLIVIASAKDPTILDEQTFAGGAVLGRAMLYDANSGVVCVGDVRAESSSSVESMEGLGGTMVTADLYVKMLDAAEQGLRAPGLAPR